MSFFDYLFDNEWKQRADIEHLRKQGSQIRSQNRRNVRDLAERVDQLEESLGTLILMCRSMAGLMQHHGIWDEQVYQEISRKIDLMDGQEDGRVTLTSPEPDPPPIGPIAIDLGEDD